MMLLVLVLMVQLLTHSTPFTLHSLISTRLNGVRPRKALSVKGLSDARWTRDVIEEGLLDASALDSDRSAWTLEPLENTDPSASNSSTPNPTSDSSGCGSSTTPTHTHFHDWQTKAGNLLDRLSVPSVAIVTQCDRSKKESEILFPSVITERSFVPEN